MLQKFRIKGWTLPCPGRGYKASKFCHVTLIKSTYALNINVFLLPTKLLPLLNYLSAQPDLCPAPRVRVRSVVTLSRPPTYSSLRITNRSFRYVSPHLWNQLPVSFCQPSTKHPPDDVTLTNLPPTCSPLSPSITHSLFHSRRVFCTRLAEWDRKLIPEMR